MGLFSPIQIVPNLVNTVNNVANLDVAGTLAAPIDVNLSLGTPAAPVVDLGITLGGGSTPVVGVPLLQPVAESLLAGADLAGALGTVLPQEGLSIGVDLGAAPAPVADLNVQLGGTGSLIAIDAEILGQNGPAPSAISGLGDLLGSALPNVALDIGLNLGSQPPAASTPVDPAAPGTGSGPEIPPAPPVPTAPPAPTGPSVDVEIDLGLGGGADEGAGNAPAPATGSNPEPVDPVGGGVPEVPPIGTGSNPAPSDPVVGVPEMPPVGVDTGSIGGVGGQADPVGTGGVPAPGAGVGTSGPVIWIGDGSGGTASSGGGSVGAEVAIGGIGTSADMSLADSIDWGQRDWLEGNDGNNTLMGLSGNDTIYGHGGDDVLYGNQNDDRLFGGRGNDILHGGRDNDFVAGDEGDDQIWGDYGDDTLEGGDGADTFYFDLNSGNDLILDFNAAQGDRLDFRGQDYAIHEVAGTAMITLSGGGAVMLSGVSAANLDAYVIG